MTAQPGFNQSLNDSIRETIGNLESLHFEQEMTAATARLLQELSQNMAWQRLRRDLEEREKAAMEQLLSDDLTPQRLGRVQGYVRALRLLTRTRTMQAEEIAAIESGLPSLREQIQQYKNLLAGQGT